MAKQRNGISFFEMTEDYADHAARRALDGVRLGDVKFPFGFFLKEENGKKHVLPGTRDDYVNTLRKAFPDYPVELITGSGPCIPDVFSEHQACKGGCPGFPSVYTCMRLFDEKQRYFGCGCVNIS